MNLPFKAIAPDGVTEVLVLGCYLGIGGPIVPSSTEHVTVLAHRVFESRNTIIGTLLLT